MLPRRTSLSRLLLILGGFVFLTWVWIVSPHSSSPVKRDVDIKHLSLVSQVQTVLDQSHNALLQQGGNSTTHAHKGDGKAFEQRAGGILRSSEGGGGGSVEQNQTLEELKHNMTMLKANMSGVGEILKNLNKSVNIRNVPNPHPFKYLINTRTICKTKDLFMLAYIHTAPSHYKRRMIIRQTWGNPKYYAGVKIRVVFVMGKTDDDSSTQDALQFEAEQYHDIVQEDFKDTYRNLTYKGIAALKWIDNNCRNAKYILKSDDDIFVNTFTLLRHLQGIERMGKNNTKLLMCLVWTRMKVMREGKWKVNKDEFKDDYYPTYCSGSAFTMSTDVAIALHNISYHVPFFWVDDFYITGLLPLKVGTIKHKQFMSTYVLDGKKLAEKFTGSQWFTYIFSHVHDLNAIQGVWQKLVELATGKKRLEVKYALPGQLPNEAELRRKETEAEKKKAAADKKKKEEEKKKKEAEKKKS